MRGEREKGRPGAPARSAFDHILRDFLEKNGSEFSAAFGHDLCISSRMVQRIFFKKRLLAIAYEASLTRLRYHSLRFWSNCMVNLAHSGMPEALRDTDSRFFVNQNGKDSQLFNELERLNA
ncbi:uncharacterized protein LOC122530437 [Frieseomelitta varia]|uniref:uncharacterized protein LOC122530437 n=1 Tax=Frieseomelitta varia TaxID=561572 RepID=UPI001CB6A3A1|nr:uncharacterized protein LOC122530437 [Frieseomelitta varia]